MPTGIHDGDRGKRRKRTAAEKLMDRMEMVKLLRQGWSLARVGEKFGISDRQVHNELKPYVTRLAAKLQQEADSAMGKALEEWEEVKIESRQAWEESKKPRMKKVVESAPVEVCPVCAGDGHISSTKGDNKPCWKCGCKGSIGGVLKTTETVESGLPDPRYLQLYGNALKEEVELRGLKGDDREGTAPVEAVPWNEVIKKAQLEVESGVDAVEEAIRQAALPPPSEVVETELETTEPAETEVDE